MQDRASKPVSRWARLLVGAATVAMGWLGAPSVDGTAAAADTPDDGGIQLKDGQVFLDLRTGVFGGPLNAGAGQATSVVMLAPPDSRVTLSYWPVADKSDCQRGTRKASREVQSIKGLERRAAMPIGRLSSGMQEFVTQLGPLMIDVDYCFHADYVEVGPVSAAARGRLTTAIDDGVRAAVDEALANATPDAPPTLITEDVVKEIVRRVPVADQPIEFEMGDDAGLTPLEPALLRTIKGDRGILDSLASVAQAQYNLRSVLQTEDALWADIRDNKLDKETSLPANATDVDALEAIVGSRGNDVAAKRTALDKLRKDSFGSASFSRAELAKLPNQSCDSATTEDLKSPSAQTCALVSRLDFLQNRFEQEATARAAAATPLDQAAGMQALTGLAQQTRRTLGRYATIEQTPDFKNRFSYYATLDLGVAPIYLTGPGEVEVASFVGINFYFDAVDKNRPILGPTGGFWRRFSLTLGATLKKAAPDPNLRLHGVLGDSWLLAGVGYRLTDYLRVSSGLVLFEQSTNPLDDKRDLVVAPFAALSIDVDLLGTISKAYAQAVGFPATVP